MSEQTPVGPQDATTATQSAEQPKPVPDDPDASADTAEHAEPDTPSRREQRYRQRLRDTEAERDTLASQVDTLQRSIAEERASAHGVSPKALWATVDGPAELLADDGTIDTSKVDTAAQQAITEFGTRPRTPHPVSAQGNGATGTPSAPDAWERAFSPPTG